MKRIAIIAALAGELKPLVQGWKSRTLKHGTLYEHEADRLKTVAIYAGVGREAAARACMYAMEEGPLGAIVSIGWAGALSPEVHTCRAYSITDVVDASTGEQYITEQKTPATEVIKLVTTKRVMNSREKHQVAEDFGAKLVDMEAATVARLARVREIPFYCYKAVSDSADESLPDMNPFITREGQMNMPRFVASVLVRPQYWSGLIRMARNSTSGAAALAGAIKSLQDELRIAAKQD